MPDVVNGTPTVLGGDRVIQDGLMRRFRVERALRHSTPIRPRARPGRFLDH